MGGDALRPIPLFGVRTMKLFQKLLLAPAALGLMAPVAASAADLNVAGVRQYTSSEEQVTSITQFSDVKPTDWAYQALSNLVERYGCVAGYPSGTYKGGQAMTRYEAAALLNACLDRITETTDELKRLMKEFEKELAVLKGRTDAIEAKVGQLEATQFSTTTKLKGLTSFVLGTNNFTGTYQALVEDNNKTLGATTFNYDLRLTLDTSFTGKDLLRTVLRTGNFCGYNGAPGSAYCSGLTYLEAAGGSQVAQPDVLGVSRIFYNFPVGKELSVTVGPKTHMTDPSMLGMWPSAYPADTVLDFFTYAGAPATYNLIAEGGGAGVVYSPLGIKGLTFSQNYISNNARIANPNIGGIGSFGAKSAAATQIAYAGEKDPLFNGGSYGLAVAYTYTQNLDLTIATPFALRAPIGVVNNLGFSGFWKPAVVGYVPSISWGISTSQHGYRDGGNVTTRRDVTTSWYTAFQWDDAFVKGNSLGMAVGQAQYWSKLASGGTPDDSNYLWEFWYKYQVTDNISVMPAIYYISDYNGSDGKTGPRSSKTNSNVFGALVKTTFKF